MGSRLVRITDKEYELLQKTRNKILHEGISNLNPQLQRNIEQKPELTQGSIVGLGLLALLILLNN